MKRFVSLTAVAALVLAAPGCDDGGASDVDAGSTPRMDGSAPRDDGGGPGTDGGPAITDGGGGGEDGGASPSDGGTTPPTDGSTPTRMGAVGSACDMDSDCTEPRGSTCMTMVGSGGFSYEFPGGYCTKEGCTAGSGSAECGAGADCYSIGFGGFGSTFCAKTCTSNADCRESEGYTCQSPPFGGGTTMYCLPPRDGGGTDGGFSFGDGGFPFP